MTKKEIVICIGNTINGLGGKAVQKSIAFGMYEPEVPVFLKKQKGKSEKDSAVQIV